MISGDCIGLDNGGTRTKVMDELFGFFMANKTNSKQFIFQVNGIFEIGKSKVILKAYHMAREKCKIHLEKPFIEYRELINNDFWDIDISSVSGMETHFPQSRNLVELISRSKNSTLCIWLFDDSKNDYWIDPENLLVERKPRDVCIKLIVEQRHSIVLEPKARIYNNLKISAFNFNEAVQFISFMFGPRFSISESYCEKVREKDPSASIMKHLEQLISDEYICEIQFTSPDDFLDEFYKDFRGTLSKSSKKILLDSADFENKIVLDFFTVEELAHAIIAYCGLHPGLLKIVCDLVINNKETINTSDDSIKNNLFKIIDDNKIVINSTIKEIYKSLDSKQRPYTKKIHKDKIYSFEKFGLIITNVNKKLKYIHLINNYIEDFQMAIVIDDLVYSFILSKFLERGSNVLNKTWEKVFPPTALYLSALQDACLLETKKYDNNENPEIDFRNFIKSKNIDDLKILEEIQDNDFEQIIGEKLLDSVKNCNQPEKYVTGVIKKANELFLESLTENNEKSASLWKSYIIKVSNHLSESQSEVLDRLTDINKNIKLMLMVNEEEEVVTYEEYNTNMNISNQNDKDPDEDLQKLEKIGLEYEFQMQYENYQALLRKQRDLNTKKNKLEGPKSNFTITNLEEEELERVNDEIKNIEENKLIIWRKILKIKEELKKLNSKDNN